MFRKKLDSGRSSNPLNFLAAMLLLLTLLTEAECFVTTSFPVRSAGATRPTFFVSNGGVRILFQSSTTDATDTDTASEGETLSDVDARVLRSMLQEKKLDLDTEEDVRKLLERGTVKTVPKRNVEKEDEDEPSEFSSKILKTLASTKLWKKVSAQASDVMESVGIWVSNKVEQDFKVLAALGVFAWDRAVRDVARALPAATAQAKSKILILTNSSSSYYGSSPPPPLEPTRNAMREMNRPADEIKSVSRELLGILSGERATATAAATNRGLRTAAPAGMGNSAERQRRAYQQRRKLDRQQRDVAKIGGSVVDTVWELRRELKAETNAPGYKTVPIRNAIEAGVAATGNVLRAAREEARLMAAKRNELRLQEARDETAQNDNLASGEPEIRQAELIGDAVETDWKPFYASEAFGTGAVERTEPARPDPEQEKLLLAELTTERARVVDRLTKCIDDPADSWLTPSVIDRLDNLDFFSGSGMQDVLTKMILLRDEIQDLANDEIASSVELSVDQLLTIRTALENLCSVMASDVSDIIADQMRVELLEQRESGDDKPLIFRLEEVVESLLTADEEKTPLNTGTSAGIEQTEVAVEAGFLAPEIFDVIPDAVFVDVIPDAFVMDTHVDDFVDEGFDAAAAGLMAEIVTDDDFENAVGAAKVAFEATGEDEELEKKDDNILVQATLRSLDVVFFLVERVLTVGVPGTVVTLKTAMIRVEKVNRNGKGSVGWKQLGNLADAKGRY